MVSQQTFRDVLAQWPSGVTIVTTLDADGSAHGMAASSFSSVSLDPPLVSVCVATRLRSHDLIAASGRFGVSVLAKDQIEVARRFGGMAGDVGDRFSGESWTTAETGVPLLDSALGWVDCTVEHAYPGGDHTIFVGSVRAAHAARRSAPLLFHSRGWGQFADAMPDVATLSDVSAESGASPSPERTADLRRAGIRVRGAGSGPFTSRLVGTPQEAASALAAGVETVEVHDLAAARGVEASASLVVERAFEPTRQDDVLALVAAAKQAGVAEVHLRDTDGLATPLHVRSLLQEAVPLARPMPLRVGLHDRGRLGLVKALTALKSGISHFDTSAHGHGGAVDTEHLVRLLDEVDVVTPVDRALLAPPHPADPGLALLTRPAVAHA